MWLLVSIISLIIFFSEFTAYTQNLGVVETHADILLTSITAARGFVLLIGSIPFADTDPVIAPVITGIMVIVFMCAGAISAVKKNLEVFLPLLLFLLFCLISIALCSVIRIPQEGMTAAFSPRYKFFVGLIWGITAGLWLPAMNAKSRQLMLVVFAAAMMVASWRGLENIRIWQTEKKEDITRWVLQGNQDSLGLAAWFNFSHEILSLAVRNQVYNPFTNRAVNFQPASFEKIDACPAFSSQITRLQSGAMHNEQAVAAKLAFVDKENTIQWIALCSLANNYMVALNDTSWVDIAQKKKKIIIDSRFLVPDSYNVLFLDNARVPVAVGIQPLLVKKWKPVFDCDESQMDRIPSRKMMVRDLCAKI